MITRLLDLLRSAGSIRTTLATVAATWGVATLQADLLETTEAMGEVEAELTAKRAELEFVTETLDRQRAKLDEIDPLLSAWLDAGAVPPAPRQSSSVDAVDGPGPGDYVPGLPVREDEPVRHVLQEQGGAYVELGSE